MRDILYEFVDLDSDESLQLLGKSLGGVLQNKALCFDNHLARGELIKACPEDGLWIRKWKFTVFQSIVMRKIPASALQEKKFVLVYFLNPGIFTVKNNRRKLSVGGSRNNLFLGSDVRMDFSVTPKQPFYVLDISFTKSWLSEQLSDANPSLLTSLDEYINKHKETIFIEASTKEEYKILQEVEVSLQADSEDSLFLRSRVYNLILNFFSKVMNRRDANLIKTTIHYEQIIQAEMILMNNIKAPPTIETIAKKVNMSVSSLLRQFKLFYGQSIYKYYVGKKMELAKKMILENRFTVNQMANMLGYKQASPFIEVFTKQYGYSPGSIKHPDNQFISY